MNTPTPVLVDFTARTTLLSAPRSLSDQSRDAMNEIEELCELVVADHDECPEDADRAVRARSAVSALDKMRRLYDMIAQLPAETQRRLFRTVLR